MWQSIESAPKDGTRIRAKRVYHDGSTVAEGEAAWRTVHFGALYHPIDGDCFAKAEDATGWMYCDVDKRFPEPTHWQPRYTGIAVGGPCDGRELSAGAKRLDIPGGAWMHRYRWDEATRRWVY